MAKLVGDVDLVIDIAREIVESVAPAEMAGFDVYANAFRADPGALDGSSEREDPLGSGWPTIVQAVVPVAFYVAGRASDIVTDKVVEKSGGRGLALLRKRFRHKGRPAEQSSATGPLSRETLDAVRAQAVKAAAESGFSAAQQEVAADAVVGYLVRMLMPKAVGKADSPK